MTRAIDARITGRVQGVSFRAYTAREATRLELAGWVRNEPDGAVVAHIEGPGDVVGEMVEWLHRGSPAADVEQVTVTDADPTGATSFVVTH